MAKKNATFEDKLAKLEQIVQAMEKEMFRWRNP